MSLVQQLFPGIKSLATCCSSWPRAPPGLRLPPPLPPARRCKHHGPRLPHGCQSSGPCIFLPELELRAPIAICLSDAGRIPTMKTPGGLQPIVYAGGEVFLVLHPF